MRVSAAVELKIGLMPFKVLSFLEPRILGTNLGWTYECLRFAKWQFPKIGGTQYRPQYSIVLIMGTPKKGTPNFGKPPSDCVFDAQEAKVVAKD